MPGPTCNDPYKNFNFRVEIRNILNGKPDRRNGSVILLDDDKTEVVRWHFSEAWIRKIEGTNLNAKGNEVAIETVVLTCEGIEREP
jgi:phage tail-like protein